METVHPEKTSPAKRLLPPHLLLGAILLSIALDRWMPLARLWQQPWIVLGAGIIAVALAVNTFLAIGFRRRKTTVDARRIGAGRLVKNQLLVVGQCPNHQMLLWSLLLN